MFFVCAHALLAEHLKRVGKAGRREALPPNLRVDKLGVGKCDVAGFQAAVGEKGLRERVFVDLAAHNVFKQFAKGFQAALVQREPCCHRVSTKFDDDFGRALGNGIQHIAQMHARNAAPRAAIVAIVVGREHEHGAVEFFFQAAGNNADHALMKAVAVHAQRGLFGRQGAGAIGKDVGEHFLFNFLARLVEFVQLACHAFGFVQAA